MAGRRYRTEILLDPEEHQALAEMAAREGRSISDLVQDMIRQYLEHRSGKEPEPEQERLLFARIAEHRAAILARRGGEPIDLDVVELIHQTWDEQDERNLGGLVDPGD